VAAIYHFTDVDNLERIIACGALLAHRDAPCAVDVGNQSIKSRRTLIEVPCGAGGTVCDYVPFYYAPRSPMLCSISYGNVDGVDPDQSRLVYLCSTTELAYGAGLECVVTDGNAAAGMTAFDDGPTSLDEIVDWPLMEAKWWNNTPEDGDRQRRRMAEFLVYEAVPLSLLTEIGVYDRSMQQRVSGIVGSAVPVNVRRDWYF
jgi:hypothetical protein